MTALLLTAAIIGPAFAPPSPPREPAPRAPEVSLMVAPDKAQILERATRLTHLNHEGRRAQRSLSRRAR